MSFQLLDIALYNSDGRNRVVSFHPGKVNVITGGSKTGKTALIDIVDYCLGRDTFTIPAGVIRDHVAWYVIRLQADKSQVVIGRPAPPPGQQSTTQAFLSVGGDLSLPEYSELQSNTNTTGLNSFLTELIGIAANENIPPEGQSRNPLQANISHAKFLCFQPQYRIADRTVLFYRQNEDFVPQSIKDTLPYFLGAVPDDRFQRLQELRRARRELKLLERRKAQDDAVRGQDNSKALALYAEAQQVGLLAPATPSSEFDILLSELRSCLNWTPDTASYDDNDALSPLQQQRDALLSELRGVQGELDAALAFGTDQDGFSDEAAEQHNRLASIGLYQTNGEAGHVCPLCSHTLETPVPSAEKIQQSLENIKLQMESVSKQRPRLEQFVNERRDRVSAIKQQLAETKAGMEAIFAQQEALQEQRSKQAVQARTVGRISLFSDSVSELAESDELERKIRKAERKVRDLEAELSDEDVEERLSSSLRIISNQMSKWAATLQLEHSEFPLEFNLPKLTVVAHRDTGPVPMSEMGSGENWVGYHLITHFALHEWFVNKTRPVPRILMLDQPTQVYFPADASEDVSVDDLEDEDRQAVQRMFKFIVDVTKSLAPNFQVIITDHADLQDDWFQDTVVERWRGGNKLIPESWYSADDA